MTVFPSHSTSTSRFTFVPSADADLLDSSGVLKQPGRLAIDSAGNLYISETLIQRVRRVDTHGVITTVAGTVKELPAGSIVFVKVCDPSKPTLWLTRWWTPPLHPFGSRDASARPDTQGRPR